MLAAVKAVRELAASRIVAAAPVGSLDACRRLEPWADEVVCARLPRNMMAVGMWYLDFTQTTDDEVRRLLQSAAGAGTAA
jgi:predicted phosphoribosyltransferase